MKIYLGLVGSENLLTPFRKGFDITEQEAYEDVITEDETTHRYTSGKIKYIFRFSYSDISETDLNVILTEFRRKTTLRLKVEKKLAPDTYNLYNVIFSGPIDYSLDTDYPGDKRYFKDISFTLKEK